MNSATLKTNQANDQEEFSENPFFSVIIPVYNRESKLTKVLDSLAAQTFKDFETIIVDDCSTDNSYEVALEYPLKKKRVIRNKTNQERSVSRNNGISKANGNYITFIDSDDFHLPEHLLLLHSEIIDKGQPEALFFTNAWDENESGKRSKRTCPELERYNTFHYILTYTFNPQRVAVHRNILSELEFDPTIPGLEDLDLWLRVAARYPIYQIPVRSTVYVNHSEAYSSDSGKYVKELTYFKYIFAKDELKGLLPQNSTNRLLSMCHYHIASKAFKDNDKLAFWLNTTMSLILYPKGYNGKTLKPLTVMMLYRLPILGYLFRQAKDFFR
ncbi:MAG: glycosyltransferase family 2 protein [Flavobacteriales bacterium]|nr:glycosyltransferase family 2 protein [Flavobacteriales bacterium]